MNQVAVNASQAAEPDKRFETLRAQCALAGVTLHRFQADGDRAVFIVTRWALTRQLDTLDDVAEWLERVSGRKAAASE